MTVVSVPTWHTAPQLPAAMLGCCAKKSPGERASHGTQRWQNPVAYEVTGADVEELIEACTDGDHLTINRLLQKGVPASSEDTETGGTALMIAALNGQKQCVQALIDGGAELDTVDPEFGMTAFLWACHAAHLRCVEALINAGCDISIREVRGTCQWLGHTWLSRFASCRSHSRLSLRESIHTSNNILYIIVARCLSLRYLTSIVTLVWVLTSACTSR